MLMLFLRFFCYTPLSDFRRLFDAVDAEMRAAFFISLCHLPLFSLYITFDAMRMPLFSAAPHFFCFLAMRFARAYYVF